MKTPLSVRIGIVSHRTVVSALILVVSGLLFVIPADALAKRRQAVEANAGRAAAFAQRFVAVEASQIEALGGQLARTYASVVVRVERDFQHFFRLLHLSHP